jgi:hypothetical protein
LKSSWNKETKYWEETYFCSPSEIQHMLKKPKISSLTLNDDIAKRIEELREKKVCGDSLSN